MLSGRGLCDELITRPEESYRLCYVVVCDLETSRIGAPHIYNISSLRVKIFRSLSYYQLRLEHQLHIFVSLKLEENSSVHKAGEERSGAFG